MGKTDSRYPTTVLPYGQKLEWNGGLYQFMPDYLENSAFPTRVLLRCMDNASVEKAVIMQSPCLSFNDDVIEAVQQAPDRLRGAMIVDPGSEDALTELRRCHSAGLTVMKFEMSVGLGLSNPNMYPTLKFDAPPITALWAEAEALGLTIVIDTSPIGGNGYQVEAIGAMAERHPGARLVLCHLGFPSKGLTEEPERYGRWLQMTALAQLPNVWFDFASLPALFPGEEYPYPTAQEYLRAFLDRHGPQKAIWATDVPGALVLATYRQLISAFDKSPLFSEEEKDAFFSKNAESAFFS